MAWSTLEHGEKVHSAAFGDNFREAGRSLSAIISAQLLTLHIWNKCHEAMMVGCGTHWLFGKMSFPDIRNTREGKCKNSTIQEELFVSWAERSPHAWVIWTKKSQWKLVGTVALTTATTFPHPLPDVYAALFFLLSWGIISLSVPHKPNAARHIIMKFSLLFIPLCFLGTIMQCY